MAGARSREVEAGLGNDHGNGHADTTSSIPAIYQQLLDPDDDELLWNPEDPAEVTDMGSIPRQHTPPPISLNAVLATLVVSAIAVLGITRVLTGPDRPVDVLGNSVQSTTSTSSPPATVAVPTTVTTTTLPPTTIPARTIAPIGDPIPIADIGMGAFGLGEFDFDIDFDFVAARLAASLGPPSDIVGPIESAGQYGTCAGSTIHAVRFGQLIIVGVEGSDGVRAFRSYRTDLSFEGEPSGLSTISGVKLGDTVASLKSTYSSLRVQFVQDPEDGVIFQLWRPSDGQLLLWGPVTSNEADGIVTGIYSPDSCGRG
ncbi:MAG: hypothetical protein KJO36_03970 [Acidimicrobiia bacterium]|nr:hypothetical protein [Acidimicrobiia bacterium]NNL47282.1 hypothetical protein [Acidimicrobiia bacterium]